MPPCSEGQCEIRNSIKNEIIQKLSEIQPVPLILIIMINTFGKMMTSEKEIQQ